MSAVLQWVIRYILRFQFAIVPLHKKAPYRERWNQHENLIHTVEAARGHWDCNPSDNAGVCLEPSHLVSLDADHKAAAAVLAAEGVDLGALISGYPTIIGRNPRIEFKAPTGIILEKKVVRWPKPDDPTGPGKLTILEFRAGANQDVLPPSVHPDTKRPYTWTTAPRHGFPPLPEEILALWLNFDAFQQRARKLCPWAKPERMVASSNYSRAHEGPSIIQAFNQAHDIVAMLQAHGYKRDGKRWRSPHAKASSAPGMVLLPSGRVYCHDSDDPLGDERAHDAFDLYVTFEHGGNIRAATRAAAQLLGMGRANGR